MISGYPLRFWWLGASAALMIVGSFGPWARALFVSVSGLDGDGWFTLIGGVAAVAVTFVFARSSTRPRPWWPLALCVGVAAVGVAITLNVWIDLETSDGGTDGASGEEELFDFDTDAVVSVSWGLVLTLAASVSLAIAAAVNFLRRSAIETAGPATPATPPPPTT